MCPKILFSTVVAIIRVVTGHLVFMVRVAGIEPARLAARDFKSLTSTYFVTLAFGTSLEN